MTEEFIFGTTKFGEEVLRNKQNQLSSIWHAHRILPRNPLPGDPVEIRVDVGTGQRADAVYCYWTTNDEQPIGYRGEAQCGNVVALEPMEPIWQDLVWGYVQPWRGVLPPQKEGTRVRYRIEAWDSLTQTSAFADNVQTDPLSAAPFAYHVDRWNSPNWIHDAVIYQILIDRFYPGDGREWNDASIKRGILGGTLRGVIDKLPYIAELGANAIWISPITQSPSWHAYNGSDLRKIAPQMGTEEDLRELVDKAHAYGIRILLDFVAHSTSDDHPFLKAAQADRNDLHFRWYTFSDWPDEYDCFFGVKVMPHLNLEYPPARKYIIDTALMWLNKFGVDGYRLDYAIKPSHDFWVDFQSALKATREAFVTLGESVTSPEHLLTFEGKLDGCLDFLLVEQIRSAFIYQALDLKTFDRNLHLQEAYFDPDFTRPSFIDNHDMNRIMFIADGDERLVKLSAVCQFTLSQPPILLYGTEIGLSQQKDSTVDLDYVREPMHWDDVQDNGLLRFYKQLIDIRAQFPALRRGQRRTLYVDPSTLIYTKGTGQDTCIVALNAGEGSKQVVLEMEEGPVHYEDGIEGTSHALTDGKLALSLSPKQSMILVPSNTDRGE